jgi:2-desacetyl-2-hydroxyethyl bacteriochlorophyllide A dehydrogenase
VRSVHVVFPEKGKIEVRKESISPPGPGEVLCAATKSLISIGTETYCLRGIFDPGSNWAQWVQYPFRPGYSMSAQVVEVGQGVTGLKAGDRVSGGSSHQQFFKARPERLHLIPNGVSDEDATWVSISMTTQLGVRRAAHAIGESVGVVGMGMLGQLVVQYLWLSGARKIVAIDPVQSRLDLAKAHGATHTLAFNVGDARSAIEEITAGKMLDVVYDITGHPAVLAPCIQLVRKLGRVVLLGDCPTPTQQFLGPGVVSNSIAILGIHGSMSPLESTDFAPWSRGEITSLFFDYLLQGRMRVSDLVTHRPSPKNAPEVYAGLVSDRSSAIGVIFDWNL